MLIINYRPIAHTHRNLAKLLVFYKRFLGIIGARRRSFLFQRVELLGPRESAFYARGFRVSLLQFVHWRVPCRSRRIIFTFHYNVLIVHNCPKLLPCFSKVAFSFYFFRFKFFFVEILSRRRHEILQFSLTFKPVLLSGVTETVTFLEFLRSNLVQVFWRFEINVCCWGLYFRESLSFWKRMFMNCVPKSV